MPSVYAHFLDALQTCKWVEWGPCKEKIRSTRPVGAVSLFSNFTARCDLSCLQLPTAALPFHRSIMSGFDVGRVYSAQVLAGSEESRAPDAPAQTEEALLQFIQRFRTGNDYIYRDRLRANLLAKQNVLDVQLEHLQLWSAYLAQQFREHPGEMLPLVSLMSRLSLRVFELLLTPLGLVNRLNRPSREQLAPSFILLPLIGVTGLKHRTFRSHSSSRQISWACAIFMPIPSPSLFECLVS